jgi:hypothetical protein
MPYSPGTPRGSSYDSDQHDTDTDTDVTDAEGDHTHSSTSLSEPPRPIYQPVPVLCHHPLHLYSPVTRTILKLLDRTRKSLAPTITLFWGFFLLSNIHSDRSTANVSTFLAIIAIFLGTRLFKIIEHLFYRRLPAKFWKRSRRARSNTEHKLRQTNRYPQLPSAREDRRFCMLGPTQWYRWQCFQDAVYFKLLGVQRSSHDDLRQKYVKVKKTFDLSKNHHPDDDFWFDFVADTGDSFNGSYSINSLLSSTISGPSFPNPLPAGSTIVHGGDLAYPWPQRHEMWNRFVLPLEYSAPLPTTHNPPKRSIFVVPGNHEWDDGLATFDSLIVNELTSIGSISVPQKSSYFALKLPRGWWVFGVDSSDNDGLETDIDDAQYNYFLTVYKNEVQDGDSIVMVNHVPEYFWNYCLGFEKGRRFCALREALGDNFAVQMSGDMHFYKRYVKKDKDDGRQYIICGGGGGFGHSTSNPVSDKTVCNYPFTTGPTQEELVLQTDYPLPSESNRYFNMNIFAFRHWGMSKMIAFFYLMMAASTDTNRAPTLRVDDSVRFIWLLRELVVESVSVFSGNFYPFLGFAVMFIIHWIFSTANSSGGKIFFVKAFCFSLSHSLAHLCLCSVLCCNVMLIWEYVLGNSLREGDELWEVTLRRSLFLFSVWALGGLLGHGVTMGYFWASYNFLDFHWNESYSAVRDEDHKNFLRCRVKRDGSLEINVVGVDKTPKRWKQNDVNAVKKGEPRLIPQGKTRYLRGKQDLICKLVETVVVERKDRRPGENLGFRKGAVRLAKKGGEAVRGGRILRDRKKKKEV